jgi:Na+-translocating ferredoxin:NAD+ oxidoreductase RnfD subunit
VHGKTVVSVAVLGAAFIGVFTLLITALNTAFTSGGLVLAPVLAGLLVTAIRYFDNPNRSLCSLRAAQNE